MSPDPRVEIVAEALAVEFEENEGITASEAAGVAVAALDAHDLGVLGALLVDLVGEDRFREIWDDDSTLFHNIRAVIEADLRGRIATEIEAEADRHKEHAVIKEDVAHYLGIRYAASIVRGETP